MQDKYAYRLASDDIELLYCCARKGTNVTISNILFLAIPDVREQEKNGTEGDSDL